MKEIREIIKAFNKIDHNTTRSALVTVVGLQGSSYRRRGARMLVMENGNYTGGISGGCLEGDALKRAQVAILKKKPSIVTYDTTQQDDNAIGVGLGCNGIIDVLFTPVDHTDPNNAIRILSAIVKTRVPKILITITKAAENLLGKTFVFEDDKMFINSFPEELNCPLVFNHIHESLNSLVSSTISYVSNIGPVNIFIEVIKPEIRIIIYGNNNDLISMAIIAKELGWEIFVVTNILKANKNLFLYADGILNIKDHTLPPADEYTAILLMTHDYSTDLSNLYKVLKSSASYIGILGPKNRTERMFGEFGLDYNNLSGIESERIFAPTGLDIGATSPEEIALSIIAEIVSKFAGRKGSFLKLKKGAINQN